MVMESAIRSVIKVSNENAIRIEDLVKKGREIPIVDNGIERFEFHEYEPVNGTNLNAGEISINVEQQDLFTLPSEAFLLSVGQLLKANGTAYANTDAVALTNNDIMQLFRQISYQLSNQDIEIVYYPGQATTMFGILKYPNDFQLAVVKPTRKGTFSLCVPLRHIFGFCDDYDKFIYGVKHTITVVRQSDDDAIFKLAAAAAGKVNLNKISLFIPYVIASNAERFKLYKQIESKVTLPVSFRARKCDSISVAQSTSFTWRLSVKTFPENPRYIIVGFQISKRGDQNVKASIFDYCDLKNIAYREQFSRAYREAAVFNEKFYGVNELITHSNITPSNYKDLYPLFVFDVSKQSERLKLSPIHVQIKATFNTAVPDVTQASTVVISDRMIEFQSDGNKMNVFY
ncbi:uncharacterized protein LOC136086373 [Hydra vulgaris]|uniref:Uncharacterized protein LOC136086373 n=1 Tax=Hydra vulgaris TaxID=6087 RepID=A0ABM4CS67_HYDVU